MFRFYCIGKVSKDLLPQEKEIQRGIVMCAVMEVCPQRGASTRVVRVGGAERDRNPEERLVTMGRQVGKAKSSIGRKYIDFKSLKM